jgi:hypothetical protein
MQIVQQVNKKQFKSALTTEKANIHLQGCDSEMAVFDTAATWSLKMAELSALYWLTTELYKVFANSSLPCTKEKKQGDIFTSKFPRRNNNSKQMKQLSEQQAYSTMEEL